MGTSEQNGFRFAMFMLGVEYMSDTGHLFCMNMVVVCGNIHESFVLLHKCKHLFVVKKLRYFIVHLTSEMLNFYFVLYFVLYHMLFMLPTSYCQIVRQIKMMPLFIELWCGECSMGVLVKAFFPPWMIFQLLTILLHATRMFCLFFYDGSHGLCSLNI